MTSGVTEYIDGTHSRRHPLYDTYSNMKSRCLNQNNPDYAKYGGRGIVVCTRWAQSFKSFVDDMGVKPHSSSTIDRINNDKGYNPDNCRWTDRTTQCHNRSEFDNNTSGCTGVKRIKSKTCPGWTAVFNDQHVRFHLGNYTNKMDAIQARVTFAELFHSNPVDAIEWLSENRPKTKRNNTTGVTGVSRMTGENSNFIIRYWCKETKSRVVVGYRDTIAKSAKLYNEYVESLKNNTSDQLLAIEKSKPRHKRTTK